jgi:hypothetical protein
MNQTSRTVAVPVLAVLGVLLAGGCIGSMTPGKMQSVQTQSDAPRAGNVYLVRGFIGLFSFGIDRLTVKVNEAGIRAHVFQEDQYGRLGKQIAATYKSAKDPEPLILIGHSLGADAALKIARVLEKEGVTVDAVFSLDPTRPPKVPKNVKICYNFYQPSVFDATGILRGIALQQDAGATGKLYNYNIRKERRDLLEWDTNHVNVDKNTKIHAEVIERLLELCPPRDAWVAARAAREGQRTAAAGHGGGGGSGNGGNGGKDNGPAGGTLGR